MLRVLGLGLSWGLYSVSAVREGDDERGGVRRWTVRPDGPDGRVDHFYADGEERPVGVVDERSFVRAVGALREVARLPELEPGQMAEDLCRARDVAMAALRVLGVDWRSEAPL